MPVVVPAGRRPPRDGRARRPFAEPAPLFNDTKLPPVAGRNGCRRPPLSGAAAAPEMTPIGSAAVSPRQLAGRGGGGAPSRLARGGEGGGGYAGGQPPPETTRQSRTPRGQSASADTYTQRRRHRQLRGVQRKQRVSPRQGVSVRVQGTLRFLLPSASAPPALRPRHSDVTNTVTPSTVTGP